MTRRIDPHAPPGWDHRLRCPPLRRRTSQPQPEPMKINPQPRAVRRGLDDDDAQSGGNSAVLWAD